MYHLRSRRLKVSLVVGVLAIAVAVPAIASSLKDAKSEHWGVIARNTIGSPVADLRDGPYAMTGTGSVTEPPYGKGSLGIEVADKATSLATPSEKVAFGNEVDFFGDPVLGLNAVGFHVFQTGENISYGGPGNMPNIALEINPNYGAPAPTVYSSMVWVPGPSPVFNEWSAYIDATTTGKWYFTNGALATATGCTQALTCNFAQAKAALDNGGAAPVIYSLAVSKGRDSMWIGAVDGLRVNNRVYNFEAGGVKAKSPGDNNDD